MRPVPTTHNAEGAFVRIGRVILFLHLFLSPLLFQRGLVEVFEYPKATLLTATAILLLACLILNNIEHEETGQKKRNRGRGMGGNGTKIFSEPIPLGMVLFLSSAFLSTLFSRSSATSFYGEHENFAGLMTITSYTILFFGAWFFCRGFDACRTLLKAVILSTFFMTLYGIAQAIGLDPFTWKRTATMGNGFMRIFGTLGHPNHLAAFLITGFPIVCAFRLQAWEQRRLLSVMTLIAIEVAAAALVVFSFSRGAWIAMVAMLMVFVWGVARVTGKKWMVMFAVLPWMIGLAIGGVTFDILPKAQDLSIKPTDGPTENAEDVQASPLTGEIGGDQSPVQDRQEIKKDDVSPVWSRIKQMGVSDLTQGTRWPIWTAALAMFLDYPLFGVGLDGFRLAFQTYRPAIYWLREWGGTPTHAQKKESCTR